MRRASLFVFLLCLAVSLPLAAQKINGTITGIVADPSGALVAGADVSIKSKATGEVRSATTSGEGTYSFPDTTIGLYDLTVKKSGFKESVTRDIDLHVSSIATINVTLALGNASEQVTVEANAVQVETATGAVGNVVEGREVRELPLNGRSFAQLTQLMPGVSPQANFDSKNKGLMAGVDFSVNGNNTTGNIFLVDGVNNNDIGSNRTILVYPSIDAIQEFKMLRNSYGPEYGQAMGAIVNIVTRGGTNQFHGAAYYFGRNDALNATDFFNNLNGVPKDKLNRNDYGYNFGGPIIKDKLFFFWSEEWNHEIRGKARSANVPTLAELGGDFSTLRVASDGSACEPAPTDPALTGNVGTFTSITQAGIAHPETINPATGTAFSTTGSLIASMFPAPNISPSNVLPGSCNNWAQSLSAPIFWRQENIRGDYKIGKTWSLMSRYTQDAWSQPFPSTLGFWGDDRYPSIESNWIQPGKQFTVKLTKLFGNTAVNDFQVSWAFNKITVGLTGDNPGLNAQINSSYTPLFGYTNKFGGNNISYPIFWGGLGNGANSDTLWEQGPWHNNEELYIIKDDFSKVMGTHTFKVGFLGSANKKNELVGGADTEAPNYWGVGGGDLLDHSADPPGTHDNLGNSTNNGTFNALWYGRLWGFGETQVNRFAQDRWKDIEFYYGDNWKAKRNLTVEYGFRWSLLRQPYSATDTIASWQPDKFDPANGTSPCNGVILVPGTDPCGPLGFAGGVPGPDRSLKENNNHAIAPRIGIAWDPRGDGKTAVRAGFGMFYQRERVTQFTTMAGVAPFSVAASGNRLLDLTGTCDNALSAGAGCQAISLAVAGAPSFGMDPSTTLPYTTQWNLTVERELARNTKLELAYVGNKGTHILRYIDANAVPADERLNFSLLNQNSLRPTGAAGFGTINYAQWSANSNYNSLQALFRTRIKGIDGQFAYTWSKSLADTDITNSGGAGQLSTLLDVTNPHMDYGPTPINRPHVFVANLVYDIPSFTGHSAPVRYALGGWELASILSYASGPSITVFNGGTPDGAPGGWSGAGTGQTSDRPFRVSGQSCYASGGQKNLWLNSNAWTVDNWNLGQFGTSPVGVCGGPGLANTDFSIYKNFKVTERVGLQFRLEFYNLFNKTQFRADQLGNQITTGGLACTTTDPTLGGDNHSINNADSPCFGRALNTVAWRDGSITGPDNQVNPNDHNGNFGLLTGDRGPREIQYALKITF